MENVITYAGFWKRFLAHFLDQLILGFILGVIFVPVWILGSLGYFIEHGSTIRHEYVRAVVQHSFDNEYSMAMFSVFILVIICMVILNIIIEWLYFAFMESSNKQATLGKIIVGIKVTDLDGNKISFGKATGRYFGKFLSGLILCFGYFMAGFTEKKQALHDILASCLVINKFNF